MSALLNWVNVVAVVGLGVLALVAVALLYLGWRRSWYVEQHDVEPWELDEYSGVHKEVPTTSKRADIVVGRVVHECSVCASLGALTWCNECGEFYCRGHWDTHYIDDHCSLTDVNRKPL